MCDTAPRRTRLPVGCGSLLARARSLERRYAPRGCQRQSHRQQVPAGVGVTPAQADQRPDDAAGGGPPADLPVQDQPPGKRPPPHQAARRAGPLPAVRDQGPAARRRPDAAGPGIRPAGLVERIRRHPVRRLHRPGGRGRSCPDLRAPGGPGSAADPRLRPGGHRRNDPSRHRRAGRHTPPGTAAAPGPARRPWQPAALMGRAGLRLCGAS